MSRDSRWTLGFPSGRSLPVRPGGTKGPPSGRGRMVASRLKRGPQARAWALATAAALGLASAGCTMCPDPFDYSGPVPNGSSPQNDFRARSNGILPLGAAPRPWPLIVKNDGRPDAGPDQDEPTPTLADEDIPADLQQTVAVVGESSDDFGAEGELEAESGEAVSPALEPVPAAVEPTDAPQEAAEVTLEQAESETEQAPVVPSNLPQSEPVVTTENGVPFQAGETPGWRSRHR